MTATRTAARPAKARIRTAALGLVALAVMAACTAGEPASDAGTHVLAEDEGWQLAVREGPRLELSTEDGHGLRTQGVSEYTRPVTLNEATSLYVTRDGDDVTLVAGPVHDDAGNVVVESTDGESANATLGAAHGLTWFWAVLPGSQQVSAITAYGADGDVVDEYTLPPMPPPDEVPVEQPSDPEDRLDSGADAG